MARMWAQAHNPVIEVKPKSITDGWELVNDVCELIMFKGPQLPDTLLLDENNTFDSHNEEDVTLYSDESDISSDDIDD